MRAIVSQIHLTRIYSRLYTDWINEIEWDVREERWLELKGLKYLKATVQMSGHLYLEIPQANGKHDEATRKLATTKYKKKEMTHQRVSSADHQILK